jgi:hypothetical protein
MEMKIAIILSRVELPFRELLRKHQTYMREVFESKVQEGYRKKEENRVMG